MGGAVEEEARFAAFYFYAHFGPGSHFHVGVGLVHFGEFFAEFGPREFGFAGVLDGVVAADLIVGSGVGGADVEELVVFGVVGCAEGYSYEASRGLGGVGAEFAGYFEFYGSVGEVASFEHGQSVYVAGAAG